MKKVKARPSHRASTRKHTTVEKKIIPQKQSLYHRLLRLTLRYFETIEEFDTALNARTATYDLLKKLNQANQAVRNVLEKFHNRPVTFDEAESFVYRLAVKKVIRECRSWAQFFNVAPSQALEGMIRGVLPC